MTNPLESIKLPLPNQEEKKQTVSSPSNSDNPLANIRQDIQEPSNIRKYQYGWAKEDMVLGDVWDIGTAWINSWGEDTYKESVQKLNEKKKKELYAEFPEFAGGKYDSDGAVMAGSISTMVADPVYILMPWARAAQGANLATKGAKLAGLGFGVGAGDSIIRQTADTGGVNFETVGKTGLYGAVLSPVAMGGQKLIGAGVNKAFPNLFKSTAEKNAIQQINAGKFKNKNNLNDDQLAKVTNISQGEKTKQLFKELSDVTNYHDTYVKPILELTEQLTSAENITKILKNTNTKKLFNDLDKILLEQNKNVFLTKGTKPYKFDILKFDSLNGKTLKSATVKEIKAALPKLEREMYKKSQLARDAMKKSNQKYLEHISLELYNSMGFTEKVMKGIMAAAIRPIVGAGGMGAVGLVGGAEEDTLEAMMYTGAVLGGFSKILNRGGIKGIPAPEQIKFAGFIPKFYIQTVDKYIRMNLATTTATRLSNRNNIMDRFSVDMFPRFTDTVRTGIFGKPIVGSDESIGLANVGDSVEGRAIDQVRKWLNMVSNNKDGGLLQNADAATQADAIKIVRGFKGEVSTEANQLATRLTTYLKDFKKYFTDAGIVPEQDIQYYFPRKLNFRLIESSQANKDEFLKGVAKAYMNIGEAKTMASALKKAKSYYKNNKKIYDDAVITDSNLKALTVTGGKKLKAIDDPIVLPINRHIKHQRKLNGTYEQVESQFEKYLVNDIPSTLSDLVQTSVKSVEFARTFGADGRLLRGYLDDLAKMYKSSSNNSTTYDGFLNFNHKGDVGHLKDAINGYFGVYGNKGDDVSRGFVAVLSSLANLNLMERVAIANIGDLSQPFSNSRYWSSWLKGLPGFFNKGAVSQVDDGHGTIVKNALKEYTPSVDKAVGGTGGQGFTAAIGKANVAFFNAVGLTALTKASRRYAFNVGAIDTHISAKNLFNTAMKKGTKDLNKLTDKKSLEEIRHLKQMGLLKVSKNGKQITNSNEVLKYGAYDSVIDAEKDVVGRILINKAGSGIANRDSIIPQIGNRLLFTQSRNPFVRLIGQYSSWAMAKSAQTNAMIQRIENGSARQLVGMAGALAIFGGIKDLRNFVTTGEFKTARSFRDDDEPWWFSQAGMFSGNLGWLPTTVANTILYRNNSSPVEFFPGVQLFNDYVDLIIDGGISAFTAATGDLNVKAYDRFLRNYYRNFPLPILRNTLERLGIGNFGTYKKDINFRDEFGKDDTDKNPGFIFNKGGLADQSRMKFNQGGFADAFAEARGNKQELFEWKGNQYTTRRADESDLQYQNFLGKKTDNKVLLKEVPEEPADVESFKQVTENIIIPKKKPILKVEKPKKSNFSLFSSAEASIPDDKQEIEVNAKKFLEKDIQPKDTVEANKFGWNKLVNKIPPNVRLMVNDVFKQSTGGKFDKIFTEKNLNPEYKSILKSIALDVLSKGKTNIEYADYKSVEGDNAYADVNYTAKGLPDISNKRFNLKTSLGQASIKVDRNGNLIIVDKFNFNDSADINSFTDFYQMVKEIGGSALQGEGYNLVRKVGKWFGSPEGEGQNVRINLGKVDLSKFKDTKIARLNLAKGDTPSRAWMRNYYFDGKGGFDTFMSFEEFATGPGIDLYLKSKGKKKGGVIQKFRGGGLYQGGRSSSRSNSFSSARSAMTSNRAYSGGGQRHNPHTSSGYSKTSNKGGGNVGSSGNNNNNNSNTVKTNSTNTKNKKDTKEQVKNWMKKNNVRVSTNIPTDIYDPDIVGKVDNLINTGPVVSVSKTGVVPNVGAYQFGVDTNKNLYGIGYNENPIGTLAGNINFADGNLTGGVTQYGPSFDIMPGDKAIMARPTGTIDYEGGDFKGNVGLSIDIGKGNTVQVGTDGLKLVSSFRKGGLLDKKRG